jgi:hypothetical protein
MNDKKEITRGGLAGKMAGFTPEPPGSVWENIVARIQKGRSLRTVFVFIAAAASLALAVTVGVHLLNVDRPQEHLLAEEGTKGSAAFPERPDENMGAASEGVPDSNAMQRLPGQEIQEKVPALSAHRKVHTVSADKKRQEASARLEEKVALAVQQALAGETVGMDVDDAVVTEREIHPVRTTISALPAAVMDSLLQQLHPTDILADEPPVQTRSAKWQLGASLSPLYTYRDVASANASRNTLVNSSESARITYSGGFQVNYSGTDRLTVESGLFFTRMGVNIGSDRNVLAGWFTEYDASAGDDAVVISVANSMGNIVTAGDKLSVRNYGGDEVALDNTVSAPENVTELYGSAERVAQLFEYLEIPLNIKYRIIDRSVRVQLIGGVSTNLMIGNSVASGAGDGMTNIGVSEDVRLVNYSGNAGLGFVYDLFDQFSLSVEPRFRYYLHSINSDALPATRPYAFGIFTGLNYTF